MLTWGKPEENLLLIFRETQPIPYPNLSGLAAREPVGTVLIQSLITSLIYQIKIHLKWLGGLLLVILCGTDTVPVKQVHITLGPASYTALCWMWCQVLLIITCRENYGSFLQTSQMSKTSATLVYKDLAVCVFRKNEFHLRQVGKDHKDGKRMGMPDTRENWKNLSWQN